MTAAALPKHIVIDERGVAWIKGTRVKVLEVALDHVAYGWSAEQIARQHPDLTLGQIHSALSCYYENKAEFEEGMAGDYESAKELSRATGDTPLRLRLRAKASGIFTVERFEEIMRKHGGVPLTAAERKKYAKFLKR